MKNTGITDPKNVQNPKRAQHNNNLIKFVFMALPLFILIVVLILAISIGNSIDVNIKLLNNDLDLLKIYAADKLGDIGHTKSVPPLINTLRDDNVKVKLAAVEALGELGDVTAIEPMGDAIGDTVQDGFVDTDDEMFIKAAILSILEIIGQNYNISSDVSNLLLDDDYLDPIRDTAHDVERKLEGLGSASSPERMKWSRIIQDTYRAALGEKDPNIRLFSLMLLGEMNDIKPVIALLEDDNDSIRLYAAMTLCDLGIDPAFVVLIEFLDHPDAGVRMMIVESLEGVRNIREADVLIRAFDDVDSDVRERAVDIILASYDDHDTDTRIIVIAAIGELGNKKMKEVLINALDDPDSLVRLAGVIELWKMGEKETVLETAKELMSTGVFDNYMMWDFHNTTINDEEDIHRRFYNHVYLSEIEHELGEMVAKENYFDELEKAPIDLYGEWVKDWMLQGGQIDCGWPNNRRSMGAIYMIPDGTAITPLYGGSSVTLIVPKGANFTIEGIGHNEIYYWDENGRASTAGFMPDIEVYPDVKSYLAGLNDTRINEVLAGCDDD